MENLFYTEIIYNNFFQNLSWFLNVTMLGRWKLMSPWEPGTVQIMSMISQHTYLYNIIHENAKLIKIILFNKHKGTHMGKRFTFTLITKLKTYQIRVWKHLWPKTRPSNFNKRKQVKQHNNIN